jgi:CelD/BcsL family acetyltransferase involved in cellulose biosynthesis
VKKTVKVWDRIEPLAIDWERLVQKAKASPFLLPGWIDGWWRSFGKGRLQIIAAYQNDRLAGVLPLRWYRGSLTSTANSETPFFDLLATNDIAAKQLVDSLFSQHARHIQLSFLHPGSKNLVHLSTRSAGYRVVADSIQALPYIPIDGLTWDAYESRLSRKLRSNLRRGRRRLEEKGQLLLTIYDGTERLQELLEEGLRLEGSGWKDAQDTSINARPQTRRFYSEVARWAAEHGWLRLCFLRLSGRAIAFDYCILYNRVIYVLKGGYDPAYRKHGPGTILTHWSLARAFSEGYDAYEFLGVSEPYKLRWASAQRELHSVHMFAPTVLGSVNFRTYMGVSLASQRAMGIVRSPHFPERGRRLVKHGYLVWRRWRDTGFL